MVLVIGEFTKTVTTACDGLRFDAGQIHAPSKRPAQRRARWRHTTVTISYYGCLPAFFYLRRFLYRLACQQQLYPLPFSQNSSQKHQNAQFVLLRECLTDVLGFRNDLFGVLNPFLFSILGEVLLVEVASDLFSRIVWVRPVC